MSKLKICGIYLIKNKVNLKIYIGQSIDIKRRISDHKKTLKSGRHCNKHLLSSFSKHGLKNFIFEILEECPAQDLNDFEKKYIDFFNSLNPAFGYNLSEVVETEYGASSAWKGRDKVSLANKGRTHSKEVREKISLAKMGNLSRTGQKNSESANQQNRERMMGNKIWVGRKHSEETRKKMSELAKGRSPIQRKKL